MIKPGLAFPLPPAAWRLAAAALVVMNGFFPAVWILFTSLKRETELVSKPITWWPHAPTLHNYVQAFTDQPLLRYLGNSAMVALLSTACSLVGIYHHASSSRRIRRLNRALWPAVDAGWRPSRQRRHSHGMPRRLRRRRRRCR